MINREDWRACVESKRPFHADDVRRLLDEIDRLGIEVKRRDVELSILKDRQRPRRIKDERPPTCKNILVWSEQSHAWLNHHYLPGVSPEDRSGGDTHWMPEPPAPPEPDEFKKWIIGYNDKVIAEQGRMPHFGDCKAGWDAAIQSTNKGD